MTGAPTKVYLMAIRDPYSIWRPFSGKSTTPLSHDIICVHTMVGTLSGSWSWANQPGNPYWHYGINAQGSIWQCQDLAWRSAANLDGNWHIIPIETSDIGEGVFPSSWSDPPWTAAQIDVLVKLIAWLCARFNIPPVLVPDTCKGRRGLAYHRQGINPWRAVDCELWSKKNGKSCPAARATQFVNTVIPRVQQLLASPPSEPDMTPEQAEQLATVAKTVRELAVSCVPFHQDSQSTDIRFQIQTLVKRALAGERRAHLRLLKRSDETQATRVWLVHGVTAVETYPGSPVHQWAKSILVDAGLSERAEPVDPRVLDGLHVAAVEGP